MIDRATDEDRSMIKVGIDTLAMDTSRYALHLATLAKARGIDPDKFHKGLGQMTMSVPAPGEDVVTMAANAAQKALEGIDTDAIDMLLFATESGVDQSKSAGVFVHGLLGLSPHCRVVELKQACYSGTAAIQMALPYLKQNPDKKVLVIASDIARYGLNTTGESSQGCAAVAMVLSVNPRVLAIEPESGMMTADVMDFWRPNYRDTALVEGKYSSRLYLSMLEKCWQQYTEKSGRTYADHDYFCYHVPVPRLVEKAHQSLVKLTDHSYLSSEETGAQVDPSLVYGRKIGNGYTAALYVGLISLLENANNHMAGKRIGFYSYGSGCVAEFFSGKVQTGYQHALHHSHHAALLKNRKILAYEDYVKFYNFHYADNGSEQIIPPYRTGAFRLTHLDGHKRIYARVPNTETALDDVDHTAQQTAAS